VGTGPGQIGLNPDGDALIVTEKGANNLLTYWVAPDGSLSAPTVTASSGMTPFGFDWTSDGRLLVAEAFGGNPGEAAVSSYALTGVEPEVISASVQNGQTAACWIVAARDAFAYTTNTPSDNISGYGIAADGSLNLFDDGGVTADMGPDQRPLDAALSSNDDYLYVLNNMSDLVVGFTIADDGSLIALSDSLSVPATSVGLAAR
jgi:6-phosphogluconolactonase (cycloisomerase 2 family)